MAARIAAAVALVALFVVTLSTACATVTPSTAAAGRSSSTQVQIGVGIDGGWTPLAPELAHRPMMTTWAQRTGSAVELRRDVVHGADADGPWMRWSNHPRTPTLHTLAVPRDWRGVDTLTITATSAVATGEQIFVALFSDNPATPAKDFFVTTITVDWAGRRTVSVPLAAMTMLGSPSGLDRVEGLFFFASAFGRVPHPDTTLVFHELAWSVRPESAASSATTTMKTAPLPDWFNHDVAEVRRPFPPKGMFQVKPWFSAERAELGYFPRYAPGFPSFTADGRVVLRLGAILQTVDRQGRWHRRDLLTEVIAPWARQHLGTDELDVAATGTSDDVAVAFDGRGGVYLVVNVSRRPDDRAGRMALLLFSPDDGRRWQVHPLPEPYARLEKPVGPRQRRDLPPAILLTTYLSPTRISLLLPRRDGDSLTLPAPLVLAEDGIALLPHSGEAGQVVSIDDDVYVTWGRLTLLPGHVDGDGAPAFVARVDRQTGTLHPPVLVGFGGESAGDDHNWPGIAVDGDGVLEVIINGHHAPVRSVRALGPLQGERWTTAEPFGAGTSYGGLVIDREGTRFVVTRAADQGYEFRLALHRRRPGQAWEAPRYLTAPHKPYYQVYFHKLVVDPRGRLFLGWWSRSATLCLFADDLAAAAARWPEREEALRAAVGDTPTWPFDAGAAYGYADVPPDEHTIIVSDDGGDTWHLATTADFQSPGPPVLEGLFTSPTPSGQLD